MNIAAAVGILLADHTTPFYQQNLALDSSTSRGHSGGIDRSRTEVRELFITIIIIIINVNQYLHCAVSVIGVLLLTRHINNKELN
jgi:hypothetical protein